MANPQKENGFTPIANEILEALARYRINGESWQCLLVIIRKTYGFQKKQDPIAASQFVELTGLKAANVNRALKWLLSRAIITVIAGDKRKPNIWLFNKDYETWNRGDKEVLLTSPMITSTPSPGMDTKESITKEKKIEKKPRTKKKQFTPPSLEEVQTFCNERNNGISAQRFIDHYTQTGWKWGKPPGYPMKDWKAAIRTWENPREPNVKKKPLQQGQDEGFV